ncbi:MAG: hypothetical protein DI626_05790 [Micavibrio aeruginosavorus]|uniref:Uncharacterized protein n=1 Tax=Micavibrio aeruginosavorus TaxID=349221 RepID=A0A2W5BY80_9BACT|nr:MAG: hypothetical protein DI626_05790 [Micavibrio aeruginosavorus]
MDLIEFCFASGIMGCLIRMTYDVHEIKGVFKAMKLAMDELQAKVSAHDIRISNLEKKGQGEHEKLVSEEG